MNKLIASNIRRTRESKSWSQRQLAEAADVSERTVQRVEDSGIVSAEVLQAIAGAFNLSVDDLRRDVDAEKLDAEMKKTTDRYVIVHLQKAESSADLARYLEGGAQFVRCAVDDDTAQDGAAELEQELKDLGDIWSDLEPLQRREAVKVAFRHVEKLASLGLAVTVG